MGHRDGTIRILHHKGLGILEMALTGGGLPIVTDGTGALEVFDDVFFEDIRH